MQGPKLTQAIQLEKANLTNSALVETQAAALPQGAVRLKVESFAVTANNVTYAVIGDMFGYWNFFPAPEGKGIVPMWGHAVVDASNHADIAVGERVYGYLPMATHLDVLPGEVRPSGFVDTTDYRQPMSIFYNQYSRLSADPEHDPLREDARMIFGPLFKTGFLIEAMFRREGWYGAESLIMTSASSKTALALAHCAKESSPAIKRIGLTSAGNADFVASTGLYDEILSYANLGQLRQLCKLPAVAVDFAGNAAVGRAIHEALMDDLKFSSMVGVTHVGAREGSGEPLPGPTPTLFFAPDQAGAAIKELGPKAFAEAVGASWGSFVSATDAFINVDHRDGLAAAKDAFQATLAGKADPAKGIVIRP